MTVIIIIIFVHMDALVLHAVTAVQLLYFNLSLDSDCSTYVRVTYAPEESGLV